MKEILMSRKNDDGKIIIKKVPENIASAYEKIGWKIYENESKSKIITKSVQEDK